MTQQKKMRMTSRTKTQNAKLKKAALTTPTRQTLAERIKAKGTPLTLPLFQDATVAREAAKDVPEIAAYDDLLRVLDSHVLTHRKTGHELHAIVWERTRAVAANARAQMLQKYLRAEGLA